MVEARKSLFRYSVEKSIFSTNGTKYLSLINIFYFMTLKGDEAIAIGKLYIPMCDTCQFKRPCSKLIAKNDGVSAFINFIQPKLPSDFEEHANCHPTVKQT